MVAQVHQVAREVLLDLLGARHELERLRLAEEPVQEYQVSLGFCCVLRFLRNYVHVERHSFGVSKSGAGVRFEGQKGRS